MTVTFADILAARNVIRGVADMTPLVPSPHLTERTGNEVLLKLETMQPTGAFKLRGALNAMAALPDDVEGVTCCSTGNHGQGVAYAARARGLRAVVCMSSLVPRAKVERIEALGAEVHISGASQDEADTESLRLAAEEGLALIPPFDDPRVVAGQGTIGFELIEARPDIATIVVPLSGGGLAGGIALAAKSANPAIRVVGVSMDRGPAMHLSLAAGHPVEVEEVPSLADSLGGGIGSDNRLTLGLCQAHLDDTLLVSEEEIRDAMQALFFEDRLVVEGGGSVGVAALLTGRIADLAGPVAVIVSGRNLDTAEFLKLISGEDLLLGDYLLKGAPYEP